MKKLLFMFLIVGVLIMLRPINAIIKDNVGNIIHRGFVVTGVVATDNGNGSYDVFIAGEAKEYPRVFTLARNPDLEVGDKVRILYKNGCKELPIILPPVKPTAVILRRYALIIASPNELKVFDMQGIVLYTLTTGGWSYAGCDITMDADENSYTETNWNLLRKWDSEGNLLVTLGIESGSNWFESLNIGPDGYLYTFEGRASGYAIAKRNTEDLTIVEDVVTFYGSYSGGICLDSDGNFYVYNGGSTDKIEKWSSAGIKLASLYVGNLYNEYAGCGVVGSNVYFVQGARKIYYAPLNLSTYTQWNLPSSEAYALTVADGKLILSGWDGDGDGATTQYDSGRNLVLQTKLEPTSSYAYKAGGYNF